MRRSSNSGLSIRDVALARSYYVLGCCLALLGPSLSFTQVLAPAELTRGVVVEQVRAGSAAEKAGLQAGDRVQIWRRAVASGRITSPLDLVELEIEQAPRGAVMLGGWRDSDEQMWALQLNDWDWGITLRPALPDTLLPVYREGRKLAEAGKPAEAAACWRTLAARMALSEQAEWVTWLEMEVGKLLAKALRWTELDDLYQAVLKRATGVRPIVVAELRRAWGKTFQQRSDWVQAERQYQQAVAESHKLGSASVSQARSLHMLGYLAWQRGDLARADEYNRQSLALKETLGLAGLDIAASLNNLGMVAWSRRELTRAEQHFHQAHTVFEKVAPASVHLAASLSNLGSLAHSRGEFTRAEDYFGQALTLYEKLAPVHLDRAKVLLNLGRVTWSQGDLVRAEAYARQALGLVERLAPDGLDLARALGNLGVVALDRGELLQAEEFLRRALAIHQKLAPGSLETFQVVNNLGNVVWARGDLAPAEEYFRQALAIQQRLALPSLDLATSFHNLGTVALSRGDWARAEDYYRQSLALKEKLAPDSLTLAVSLHNLGALAWRRRDLVQAEQYLNRALALKQKLAPTGLEVAATLDNLGNVAEDRGHLVLAEQYFRQSLAIYERLAPNSRRHAELLHSVGLILRRQGRLDQAAPFLHQALETLENQTARLGGTEETRSSFRAKYAGYYRDTLELLLAQQQAERAFQVLERSRARSLLALLAERDLVFAADLPSDIQHQRQRNAAAYDRTQAQIARLHPVHEAAQIESLLERLGQLRREREHIVEQVRRASPRLAALQYPQPLDLATTRQALDVGTTLLSYSVGTEQTHVFVVPAATGEPGLAIFTLPIGEKLLRRHIDEFRRLLAQRDPAGRAALSSLARTLYDLLLRPAEVHLQASQRLLLVPDGPLHALPFAALQRDAKQYLAQWKPLHTVVSATVYAELKRLRGQQQTAAVELAAFGDPRYPPLDAAYLARTKNLELRAALVGGRRFARLPFSREEVASLLALYPERSQAYMGEEATEERVKVLGRRVRYIHFATHGLLDERFPLDSALAFSIPPEFTEGQDNGLLQAWEIFEQVRLDADLVVLSACQTGLGQELSGEGLIGLTRAFQYAGAHSILASLWSVDDRKTGQLMKSFYQHVKSGRSKDEALQSAQLELLRSAASAHPFYWAAFSLFGDWK